MTWPGIAATAVSSSATWGSARAVAIPFILNLPSLGFANQQVRKQRLVIMFSPNGVILSTFWPDEEGASFRPSRRASSRWSRTRIAGIAGPAWPLM